jgi:hypothetical protein
MEGLSPAMKRIDHLFSDWRRSLAAGLLLGLMAAPGCQPPGETVLTKPDASKATQPVTAPVGPSASKKPDVKKSGLTQSRRDREKARSEQGTSK